VPPDGEDGNARAPERSPGRGEVYFEFHKVGQTMKVTAVDAASGVEVVVMGPASAAQADLQSIAMRKLKARLEREGS